MPPKRPSESVKCFPPDATAAFHHLFEAHETARGLGLSPEEFASQLPDLQRLGFSDVTLRLLMSLGLVSHLVETTSPEAKARTFQPCRNARFREASCFVV